MKKFLLPVPRAIVWVLLMAITVPIVSCVLPQVDRETYLPPTKTRPEISIMDLEKKVHALINQERRKHRLSPMEWDVGLVGIARKHSRDMAERRYFAHTSPEGHDFPFRYQHGGYACSVPIGKAISAGAENILQTNLYDSITTVNGRTYYNWSSLEKIAETALEIWLKSPDHRENILAPHWKRQGIGAAIAPDGKVYITQNFC